MDFFKDTIIYTAKRKLLSHIIPADDIPTRLAFKVPLKNKDRWIRTSVQHLFTDIET